MAINWYEENGRKKCLITVNVRSKIDPTVRKQKKQRYDVIDDEMTEAKAVREEAKLQREADRLVYEAESLGMSWKRLLEFYETEGFKALKLGTWSQREPCFKDSLSSLNRFTAEWVELRAGEIAPVNVTRLLHKLEAQGLAGSTVTRLLGDVRKVFDLALLHEIKGLTRNPTTGISIKSRRRKRDEILSRDEIKKLLVYAKMYEPQWYFIWSFAVYTGLRNGELYALKWSDVDFDSDCPLIRVTTSYSKRTRTYKETKTGESREIPICQPLFEVMSELKKWHIHEVTRTSKPTTEYVLPRPGLWQNGSQAKVLREFCKEIGIAPICFHSLRACFATELLRRGVPQIKVQAVGGWADMKSMTHYVRLSGINVKGVTDALDFTSPEMQINPNRELMKVVGDHYRPTDDDLKNVEPLRTRRLQNV
ncbi:MAG: tyrosine-type recombinase/integrase [Bdellovibrionales bacterium]